MCVRPEHFLFAAVPVVSGRRPPAGRGSVRRDQQEPGRGETLRRVWGRVHAEVQPGQILPGLRGADAPEERSRTTAAKILAAFREMSCAKGRFFQKDTIDYNYPREREVHSNGRIDKY